MATPSPLDPTALWRDLVSQWEKGINEVANRAMASDEFNRGMHGGLGVSLTAQKALGDVLGRYLTALNLPTRHEITQLGERLQSIEERLIRIAAVLDQGAGPSGAGGPAAALPKPRRTRRPPAAPSPESIAGSRTEPQAESRAEPQAAPRAAPRAEPEAGPQAESRSRARRPEPERTAGRAATSRPAAGRQPAPRRTRKAAS